MKLAYAALSDDDKLDFVRKCIDEVAKQKNGSSALSFLTNKELRLFKKGGVRPNPYNLFMRDYCANSKKHWSTCSEAYRSLSEREKQKYRDEAMAIRVANAQKTAAKHTDESLGKGVFVTDLLEATAKLEKSEKINKSNKKDKKKSVADETSVPEEQAVPAEQDSFKTPSKKEDVSFKSPSKRTPSALDTSTASTSNGSSTKKRKLSPSKSLSETPVKIKKEKVRIPEPERVPT